MECMIASQKTGRLRSGDARANLRHRLASPQGPDELPSPHYPFDARVCNDQTALLLAHLLKTPTKCRLSRTKQIPPTWSGIPRLDPRPS